MRRWFPLIIIIPVIEMILLYLSGKFIGLLPTLLIVIATGFIGFRLARSQGASILMRIREDLSHGRIPGERAIEGFLILIGGIFLVFPGYLTDLAGFLLMVPQWRRKLIHAFQKWITYRFQRGHFFFMFRR
ncbi:MAG: FxsA family protein [Tuberibacillus sp.]